MAIAERLPKQINWKIWAGVALAALVVLGGLGYFFDWFGTGATEALAPATDGAATATE